MAGPKRGGGGQLASLQAIRAIAALLVLGHHASDRVTNSHTLLNYGATGVDLFFVLSGFVIFYAHREDIGTREIFRFVRYAWRRFVRIYPTYIVITLLFLPAIVYENPKLFEWPALVTSLFITGSDDRLFLLQVAWTLVHEVHFYIAFGICILLPPAAAVILFLVLSGLALCGAELPVISQFLPTSSIDFEFTLGIIAAVLHLKRPWPAVIRIVSLLLGGVCFVLFATNSIVFPMPIDEHWPLGLSAAFIVFGAAGLPFHNRLAERIGNASYIIYLIHVPALMVFTALMWKAGLKSAPEPGPIYALIPAIALASCAIVAISIMLHEHIESPFLDWAKKYPRKLDVVATIRKLRQS